MEIATCMGGVRMCIYLPAKSFSTNFGDASTWLIISNAIQCKSIPGMDCRSSMTLIALLDRHRPGLHSNIITQGEDAVHRIIAWSFLFKEYLTSGSASKDPKLVKRESPGYDESTINLCVTLFLPSRLYLSKFWHGRNYAPFPSARMTTGVAALVTHALKGSRRTFHRLHLSLPIFKLTSTLCLSMCISGCKKRLLRGFKNLAALVQGQSPVILTVAISNDFQDQIDIVFQCDAKLQCVSDRRLVWFANSFPACREGFADLNSPIPDYRKQFIKEWDQADSQIWWSPSTTRIDGVQTQIDIDIFNVIRNFR